ncbi:MAG: Hsp70 family protein [bacterium]|nr:Hsp70 family protein [bacterium]
MKNAFLGIDLGTTYSACAYIDDDGKAQIVRNQIGENTTPSVVYLEQKDSVIVGQAAKRKRCIQSGKVVDLVKNSMGKVNPDQTPVMIRTDFGEYMPEAISSYILRQLVTDANVQFGLEEGIKDVVVTIPAYFDDAQRTATDNAINMAGLNRLGFINEPTAAALYYAQQSGIGTANILVYDLGGGTFDVSIVHIAGHAREVISTNGLPRVGGSFFDKEIVERICGHFSKKYGIELTQPEYADVRQDLFEKAERAKIDLSSINMSSITVRVGSAVETYEITREDIEAIVEKLYKKTEACIRMALKDASLTVDQIDQIVLVGGSSRIPYIQEHLKAYFGKEPCKGVNADEVVALGAAIYAQQLKEGKDVEISDVNSHSIGIRAINPKTGLEFNDILIKRNSKLPASVERGYVLKGTEINRLFINVFEGEYKEISDVSEICAVDVSVPADLKTDTRVFIRLEIDKYQILHMYVRLPDAGNIEKEIVFERKSNMSESQISEWKKANVDSVVGVESAPKMKKNLLKRLFGAMDLSEEAQSEQTGETDGSDDLIAPEVKKAKEAAKKVDPAKKIPPVIQNVMQDVIGMDEVAEALRDYKNRFEMEQKRSSFGKTDEFSHCVAIYGKRGIGTTTAAMRVADCLHKLGIVTNAVPVMATIDDIVKKDEQETVSAIQELFQRAMNGVLIIDDFHRFQDDNENAPGMMAADLLWKAYEASNHQVVIILAGYSKKMKLLMDAKPRFARLFLSNSIDLMGYSAGEYVQILHAIAAERGYVVDDFADAELERNIKGVMRLPDFKHIYYLTDDLLDQAITNAANKASAKRRATDDDYTILRKENFVFRDEQKSLEELLEELDSLTGLHTVKKQIHELVKKQETIQRAEREGKKLPGEQGTMHMIFTGNAGTGKTVVARLVAEIYRELGVITRGQLVEVDRSKLVSEFVGKTAQLVAEKVNEAMGGVLFIDEAYSLCRDDQDSFGQEAVDALVPLLENHRKNFVCIMAGYTGDMEKFLDRNQGLRNRFPNRIEFEDYTIDELMSIFQGMVSDDHYCIEKRALEAARAIIEDQMRVPGFGNGRGVRQIYEKVRDQHTVRMGETSDWGDNEHMIIRLEDVGDGVVPKTETVEDVLAELDALTGLEGVKKQVHSIVNIAKLNAQRRANGEAELEHGSMHMIFTGNAGTGKTTVARMIARIYKSIGVLPTSRCVETGRSGLVAQYVGQTAVQTEKIVKSAFGGVLFIDEAYQLIQGGDGDFGKEAVETLVAMLENHRDQFVCIMAGYAEDMQKLINSNQGLTSRFKTIIDFADYTVDELATIFTSEMRNRQMTLGPCVEESAKRLIAARYKMPGFGNARGVRNICDEIILNYANRIAANPEEMTGNTILQEDVEALMAGEKVDSVEDILAELNSYIGLASVKRQVQMLVNTTRVNKMRQEAGIDISGAGTMHMVFSGSPGTGKTTVARLIGKIYYALGLIASSKVIEVGRTDLVGRYVGETAQKTTDVVNRALGGILFIDEAYQLMDKKDSGGYGAEAIDTLVALLENHKNDFVCVVAGYTNEMEDFLDQNPGLKSRFPTTIEFEDYTLDELCQIFELTVKQKRFMMADGVKDKAYALIEEKSQMKDFGNGRGVRNLVDQVVANMNTRITNMALSGMNPAHEALITIIPEDIC